jgi:hypothetical protein
LALVAQARQQARQPLLIHLQAVQRVHSFLLL